MKAAVQKNEMIRIIDSIDFSLFLKRNTNIKMFIQLLLATNDGVHARNSYVLITCTLTGRTTGHWSL